MAGRKAVVKAEQPAAAGAKTPKVFKEVRVRPGQARAAARRGSARVDSGSGGQARRTVSMPSDVMARVEERVGPREFSAYVTYAVRRQLERDNLRELLDEFPEPLTDADRERVDARLSAALDDVR